MRAYSFCRPWIIAGIVTAAGCSANDNTTRYSSGVDTAKPITDLTPAERTELCTTRVAYVQTHVDTSSITRFWCAFTPAVTGAHDPAACQSALDACVHTYAVQVNVEVNLPPEVICSDATVTTGSCNGTVGDYESCVNDSVNVSLSGGPQWPCGGASDGGVSDGGAVTPVVTVSACAKLGPSCPAVQAPPVVK